MRWSPSDTMCVNQTAVVQPRLVPSQLPGGLKYSSSSSAIPMSSLWANTMGISSTRSVVTVTCSVIPTAYRIFKILSPFDRTMSIKLIMLAFSRVGSIPEIPVENVPVATALLPDMQKDNQQKDTHTALIWLLVISVACAGMQTGMRVL